MPSESSFKKQADLAQDALQSFTAVQSLKSPVVIKAALDDLVAATVAFNNFVPFFTSHSLFLEIPPAVFHVLEKFIHKNPNFDMPSDYAKIVGLDTRIREYLAQPVPVKKEPAVVSAPRVDKPKKNKVTSKRLRLSKEFIDDSDGDEPARFLAPPSITPSSDTSGPKTADEVISKVLNKVSDLANGTPKNVVPDRGAKPSTTPCSAHQDKKHAFATCKNCLDQGAPMDIDEPVPPISNSDHDAIARALTITSNPTIIEITDESSKGNDFLQNSLRLQILQGCQHLRGYLSSVDQLMARYHKLVTANSASNSSASTSDNA